MPRGSDPLAPVGNSGVGVNRRGDPIAASSSVAPVLADLPAQVSLNPMQKRRLEAEIAQLQSEGYGPEELDDYAKGFQEGYSRPPSLNLALGKVAAGATFEKADELKGLIQSKVTGRSRLFETARSRGELARMGKEYPKTSLGLEIAGSIPTSMLLGRGITGATGGPAKTLLGKVGQGLTAGAVGGADIGASSAVGGLEPRTINALLGGLGGGVIGGLAVPFVEVGSAIARQVGAALFPGAAEKQAKRMLQQVISETPGEPGVAGIMSRATGPAPPVDTLRQPTPPPTGFVPEDYASLIGGRMREAQAGGTPFTLGEAIGPGGVSLLETAAQAGGPGQIAAKIGLETRQRAQPSRLIDLVRRTSGVTEGSVDRQLAEKAARSAAAGPNYAALGGVDAPDEVMQQVVGLLRTKAGKAAYEEAAEAAEQAALRGAPGGALPSFEAITNGTRLTAGEADTLLQGLEAFAETKMTSPMFTGGPMIETKRSYPFNQTARELRELMAKRIPEFEKARAEFKAPSDFIKAIDIGDKVRKMDLDTFKTYWRDLKPAQQEGTTIGLINDLKAELQDFIAGPTANAARMLSKKESLRDKLRIAMGPDADELLQVADIENLTSENVAQIMGGPASARRIAGEKALGEPMEKIPTSVAGVTAKALGWLDETTKRKTRAALARLGLTANPDRAEAIVKEIMAIRPSSRSAITGAMLGVPTSKAANSIIDRR